MKIKTLYSTFFSRGSVFSFSVFSHKCISSTKGLFLFLENLRKTKVGDGGSTKPEDLLKENRGGMGGSS